MTPTGEAKYLPSPDEIERETQKLKEAHLARRRGETPQQPREPAIREIETDGLDLDTDE